MMLARLASIATLALLAACDLAVTDDISIPAGAFAAQGGVTVNGNVLIGESANVSEGDFRTVNGDIYVATLARVNDCATVNGSVRVESGAEIGHIETVNGSLLLDTDVQVGGDIKLVNGRVSLSKGTQVAGNVGTVNGQIELSGSRVMGTLSNYNGGMTITDGSVVEGDLIIREPNGDLGERPPRVVIGPNSQVLGSLIFERVVELFLHETATTGPITGASVVRFAGAMPEAG